VRHGGARGAYGRHQVDIEAALPGLICVALARTAGVVNENIDAAQLRCGFLHDFLDIARLRHVSDDAQGIYAALSQLSFSLAQALLAASAKGDVAALSCQRQTDRAADAAATARDDRDFPL
jgi:hypothetical protein